MKAAFLVLLWCIAVFQSMFTLYKIVPPETQYDFVELFGIYGDERIMDFVLYVFFGMAIFIASVITLSLYLLIRKR